MPELPEVETVINYLKSQIINSKILDVEIRNHKFLKNRNLELLLINKTNANLELTDKSEESKQYFHDDLYENLIHFLNHLDELLLLS